MNSNSTTAETALRRETSGLGTMIKALAWEECRVGGVIAGWCLIVGVICLAVCRLSLTAAAWSHDRELVLMFVAGMPMLTALLLILSTDYSGHLVGGFSQRILHLPVPATAAIAVALLARTVLVFISALVFTLACHALFGDGPGIGAVPGITLFYLFAQTLDWLRKPLSGLSSLIVVVSSVAFIVFLGRFETNVEGTRYFFTQTAALTMLLGAVMIPAYGIAVAAVHAARVGRRIGIPELWELPRYISVPWFARSKPFATPLAAQVWFDLRRSWGVLPGVMTLFCLLATGTIWLIRESDEDPYNIVRFAVSVGTFVGAVLGAAAHSKQTGLALGRHAKPQPQFLHPLTSAQFAFSRIVSCAAILVPMVAVALVLHFTLVVGRLLTEIIPDALAIGATSYREVFWVLLSRGLLVGLIAWPLMNGGNRTIASTLLAELALAMALVWLHYRHVVDWQYSRIILPLVVIGVTIGTYSHAWKSGVLPMRALMIAAGVWALATGVLLHAVLTVTPIGGPQFLWYATSFVTCLGWASLIPLPYVGVALEVRRRRHAAPAPQDRAQHVTANATLFTGPARTASRIAAAGVILLLIWLAWPAPPAYEAFLRAKGYPATPDELNEWYQAVPAEKNRALAYLDLEPKLEKAYGIFYAQYAKPALEEEPGDHRAGIAAPSPAPPYETESLTKRLLIVGGAKAQRGQPIAGDTWEISDAYWQDVTSVVAPELKQIAADTTMGSRYPSDLRKGFAVELPHLSQLREMGRQLALDSLHWTLANDPRKAEESVGAMIPLANSLSEEPLLISQLVRIAILGIAYGTSEDIMNRSVPADADLSRLDQVFAGAVPPVQERMMLDRAMIGEATIGLRSVASLEALDVSDLGQNSALHLSGTAVLFWQLAAPAAAERMVMTRYYSNLLDHSKVPMRSNWQWMGNTDDQMVDDMALISPLAAILAPAIGRSYEAEWRVRTQFDIARTAIAVERYRLANGRLPAALQDLVPAFLPEVPMDYFANGEDPLRYRQLGEDSYVVYSVGRDGEDDQGVEMDNWWQEGDITFTVAPLSVRTGPQVADSESMRSGQTE